MTGGGARLGWESDEGSTLPLLIGAAALALVLTLVVASASGLYLERKRLLVLADTAARAGAEAFTLDDVQVDTDGTVAIDLKTERVEAAIRDFIQRRPAGEFEELRVVRATSLDRRSATVEVSAMWRPPVVTLVLPDGIRIDAVSTARTVLHEPSIH